MRSIHFFIICILIIVGATLIRVLRPVDSPEEMQHQEEMVRLKLDTMPYDSIVVIDNIRYKLVKI